MSAKVFRSDRGTLSKPVELPNGWLRVDGYIARTGVLEYRRADGSIWREYRAPEEAFSEATLASFNLVPLTNDHPEDGLLTADNTRDYQRGTVERPTRDGEKVRASILVTDAEAIEDLRSGKAELSSGYLCDVIIEAGVSPSGERYDARQVAVVGNHVALVRAGRAGRECRVRLDSAKADVVLSDSTQIGNADHPSDPKDMIKITIGGVQYEVSEQVAQALGRERADSAQSLAAVKDETAKLQVRADTAEADLVKAKKALDEQQVREQKKAREALEAKVAEHLDGVELDGMSDIDVKRAFASKVLGRKLDGKPDAYVEASYEMALERADEGETVDEDTETSPIHTDAADLGDASAKAQADYQAALKKHF